MPARRESQCTIDRLPEVERKKVLDALLTGASLRTVAQMAGCSTTAVMAYKKRVVKPALKLAQQIQPFQLLDTPDAVKAAQHRALTRDVIASSPFRERLEKLWGRADRALERAEKMGDAGLPVTPGLLNQAHKNVELLGRVTGELETSPAANVAIQIVMPQVAAALPEAGRADAPVIDIAVVKR